jgi:hypothetical protein
MIHVFIVFFQVIDATPENQVKSLDARPTWYLGKIACVLTSPRLNPRLPAQLTAGLVQECQKQSLHGAPPERVSARQKFTTGSAVALPE